MLQKLFHVGDEGGGLDDIVECCADRLKASLDVLANLNHLGTHVAFADTTAVKRPRELTREENVTRSLLDSNNLSHRDQSAT